MEIYFTNLCNIILFNQVLNFGAGLRIGNLIVLLIPVAFNFKMMDMHTFIQ